MKSGVTIRNGHPTLLISTALTYGLLLGTVIQQHFIEPP